MREPTHASHLRFGSTKKYPIIAAEWDRAELSDLMLSLAKGTQNTGPELAEFGTRLRALYDDHPILLFNRGRHALEIALLTLSERRPQKNEVIFPGYICLSVLHAIERCGLTPIAVDIRRDLNIDPDDVRQHISSRTLAVIVPHMYGCPAPIRQIEEICLSHDVFLVDDAAQIVDIKLDGKPLGTFGHCGIASFSQSKTVVAGEGNAGGALIVNDPSLEPTLRAKWAALPDALYRRSDLPSFLPDGVLPDPHAFWNYYPAALRDRLTGKRPQSKPSVARKMANVNAILGLHQLETLSGRIAGRTRVASDFNAQLVGDDIATFLQYEPDRYLTRIMLLMPEGLDISRLRQHLRKARIATRRAYDVVAPDAGGLRHARSLACRLLEIPSHSRMTTKTVAHICTIFKDLLSAAYHHH